MTKTIYLVRHAEPIVKNGRKHSLTHRGREQATRLACAIAQDLEGRNTSIHHSPVIRCIETAQIIADELGLPAIEAPLRLKGADNLTIREAQSKLSQYLESYEKLSIEPPSVFASRIAEYIRGQQEEVLILVGNEVPLRLLLNHFTEAGFNKAFEHGSYIKIRYTIT